MKDEDHLPLFFQQSIKFASREGFQLLLRNVCSNFQG